MSIPFKTQIKKIREEAIQLGFNVSTIDGYEMIWYKFIKWKNENNFEYNEKDYCDFLFDYYKFDTNKYTSKSKSRHQQLMRSKRMLDNFDEYKNKIISEALPKALYSDYPSSWNNILESYLSFCKNVRQNANSTIKEKRNYLERELSYFYNHGMRNLSQFSINYINIFINGTIKAGNVSKRRTFYILRDFLIYLYIDDILKEDLSYLIPKIRTARRKKMPTYIKPEKIEELLKLIPRERQIDKRNYAIIIIAARLGLRISDILHIKLKDIDWKNNKITVIQPKTKNRNVLPLINEVGWAIIDYIKVRPKCNNEYLFTKNKYPFERLEQFNEFNKFFNKANIEINENNKKGIHNLRSSLAKNLLDNAIPLPIIASTLGDSLEVTSNTYIKVDIDNLKKCTLEVEE